MRRVALDTNLLLLLVIGCSAGRVVGKRLKAFVDEDIAVVADFVSPFDRLITTPNVWTEFFNTWDWGIDGALRNAILEDAVATVMRSVEIARSTSDIVRDPDIGRLGLTDCTWLDVLDSSTTLLTDDVALWNTALSRGFKAVNFNHIRSLT